MKRVKEWFRALHNAPGDTTAATAFGATRRTLQEPAKKLIKSDRTPEEAVRHKEEARRKLDEAKGIGLLDSWKVENEVPVLWVGPAWNNADPKAKKVFLQHANTFFLDGRKASTRLVTKAPVPRRKMAARGTYKPNAA